MIIANHIARDVARHRLTYESECPIERWVSLPEFLEDQVAQRIWAECRAGNYGTFCGYVRPGEDGIRNEFHEPNLENTYISVHKRSVAPLPVIAELDRAMGTPETVALLRELTGEPVQRAGHPSTLTCWERESFVTPHSDAGGREGGARLVLWVWFSTDWRREFGGTTGFRWPNMSAPHELLPEFNRAVLFRPFEGSLHWVNPLADLAPEKGRFTWTMHYF